jgi:hypothetical protein
MSSRKAPTYEQQRELRRLAMARGVSFTPPKTSAEASAEIRRLRKMRPQSRFDQRFEDRGVSFDMAVRRGDAARVRPSEVEGFGSSATWSQRR